MKYYRVKIENKNWMTLVFPVRANTSAFFVCDSGMQGK